jgi:hypothetical protein
MNHSHQLDHLFFASTISPSNAHIPDDSIVVFFDSPGTVLKIDKEIPDCELNWLHHLSWHIS